MDEWEKTARRLPCGRSIRVKCCREDRSQVITHSDKGYSAYCFRCGDDSRKFRPHGVRSVGEMLQHRRELDAYITERGALSLPADFKVLCAEIPREAIRWFLVSGVSSSVARHYQFGYSESLARTVMPVWDAAGRLVAVQSRAIYPNQQPKYLNKTGGDKSPVFESDDALLLHSPVTDRIVITEDILSAVRVGRLSPALSTMGTHVSENLAVRADLAKAGVFIWYDGDEAGIKGAKQAKKKFDLMGIPCGIIHTDKDPKGYNNDEIREIIKTYT